MPPASAASALPVPPELTAAVEELCRRVLPDEGRLRESYLGSDLEEAMRAYASGCAAMRAALERLSAGRADSLEAINETLAVVVPIVYRQAPELRRAFEERLRGVLGSIVRYTERLAAQASADLSSAPPPPPPLTDEERAYLMPRGARAEDPAAPRLLCSGCLEARTRLRVCSPCGHAALCDECCDGLLRQPSAPRLACPSCRSPTDRFLPLYATAG